jgi:hypothetical protein
MIERAPIYLEACFEHERIRQARQNTPAAIPPESIELTLEKKTEDKETPRTDTIKYTEETNNAMITFQNILKALYLCLHSC